MLFLLETSHSSHGATFNDLGRHGIGFGQLGSDRFRVSAVSDAGSGGTGGYGGSGGGDNGGSGEGGGNGDEKNWYLLSWYLGLLAKYPVTVKAVTSPLLTLIGDLICQLEIDQVPSLFTLLRLVLVGPTLHFWNLYLSKLVTLPGASSAFLHLVLDQITSCRCCLPSAISVTFIVTFKAFLFKLRSNESPVT